MYLSGILAPLVSDLRVGETTNLLGVGSGSVVSLSPSELVSSSRCESWISGKRGTTGGAGVVEAERPRLGKRGRRGADEDFLLAAAAGAGFFLPESVEAGEEVDAVLEAAGLGTAGVLALAARGAFFFASLGLVFSPLASVAVMKETMLRMAGPVARYSMRLPSRAAGGDLMRTEPETRLYSRILALPGL